MLLTLVDSYVASFKLDTPELITEVTLTYLYLVQALKYLAVDIYPITFVKLQKLCTFITKNLSSLS